MATGGGVESRLALVCFPDPNQAIGEDPTWRTREPAEDVQLSWEGVAVLYRDVVQAMVFKQGHNT